MRYIMSPSPNARQCPDCGASEMVSVRLVVAESPVEFSSCNACESRWWECDGEMLGLDSVLDLVGRH
jgi:hypothetical protein